MLQAIVIGNVGADAQVQSKDGKEFTTFRVAHNDVWTDAAGVQHSNTVWVDCVMNGHPKVADYIKGGTLVVVNGDVTLRVYSSAKDRCMKAGMSVRVSSVQLLGGSSDEVPRRLYDSAGVQHDVEKFFLTDVKGCRLQSQRGAPFDVDDAGWVRPADVQQVSAVTASPNGQQQVNADGSPSQVY